ncbi:hypothetical protein [Nocardia sp. NPDC004750]
MSIRVTATTRFCASPEAIGRVMYMLDTSAFSGWMPAGSLSDAEVVTEDVRRRTPSAGRPRRIRSERRLSSTRTMGRFSDQFVQVSTQLLDALRARDATELLHILIDVVESGVQTGQWPLEGRSLLDAQSVGVIRQRPGLCGFPGSHEKGRQRFRGVM